MNKQSKIFIALVLCISLLAPSFTEIVKATVDFTGDSAIESVTASTNIVLTPKVDNDNITGSAYIDNVNGAFQIIGAENALAGQSLQLSATSNTNGYKATNLEWESSDREVVTVTKTGRVSVVGPGMVTLNYSYPYQILGTASSEYTEQRTEADGTGSTDESGNPVFDTKTTELTTYDYTHYVRGSVTMMVNVQILSTTNRMIPGDVLNIQTNIPVSSSKDVTWKFDANSAGMTVTNGPAINGYKSAIATATQIGTASVRAVYNGYQSNPFDITVVSNFSMSTDKITWQQYSFSKDTLGNQVPDFTKTFDLSAFSNETGTIHWYFGDPDNGGIEFTNGTAYRGVVGTFTNADGAANRNASFRITEDYIIDDSVTNNTFTIYAIQEGASVTKKMTCVVTVNRPVSPNKITIDPNNDSVSTVELYEGESELMTITMQSEDGKVPGNRGVRWDSSDSAVINVGSSESEVEGGLLTNNCQIFALSAGNCAIYATTDDGGYQKVVNFIVRPYPNKVTLNPSEITLGLSDSTAADANKLQITAEVSCGNTIKDNYIDDSLVWTCVSAGSTTVATVDQNGVVTLVSPGTATITATSYAARDNADFIKNAPFATCIVTVKRMATDLTLSNVPTEPITVGTSRRIGYTIEPTNATVNSTKYPISWSTSNPEIVTVDAEGYITAVGSGRATIRAQINDSSGIYRTFNVTVKQVDTGIVLNHDEIKISRGGTVNMIATLLPANTTDKQITWTTSNRNIASVSYSENAANSYRCVVTGVTVGGPVYITATTASGRTVRCKVTVTEPVTGLKISPKKKTIYVGKKFTIKSTIYPIGASTNSDLIYTSSDPSVAKVDSKGKVTPLAGGKATITVETVDGGYKKTCVVTVKEKVSSITFPDKNVYIQVGTTRKLKPSILNKTATNRSVTWKSSKKSIATVSSKGKVKAKKTGTTVITCTAKDGSKVKGKCYVHVIRKVVSLKLSNYDMTMITDNIYKIKAKVSPSNATLKSVKWTSTNPAIARVTRTGKIYALTPGICYIKCKTTDGSNLTKSCRVKVIEEVPVESVAISIENITLVKGKGTQLESRVYPTNATSSIRWMSDDETIAKVSNTGNVVAVGPGTTTITAYSKEGAEAQCKIEVIAMNQTSVSMEQYDKYKLNVDGAGTGTITWSSTNANVATVTQSGEVLAIASGSTTIKATYNGKVVTCKVKVKKLQ